VQKVTVPNVLLKDLADAQADMTNAGLTLDLTGTEITNDPTKDNTVATQDPAGGTEADEGSFVNVTAYMYQPDVPDFTGMTLAEANAAAAVADLGAVSNNTSMDVATADNLLWGTIIAQNPATCSTCVDPGTPVEVGLYVEP